MRLVMFYVDSVASGRVFLNPDDVSSVCQHEDGVDIRMRDGTLWHTIDDDADIAGVIRDLCGDA